MQEALDTNRKMNEGLDAKLLKLTEDYRDLQNTFSAMAAQQTQGQAKGKIEVMNCSLDIGVCSRDS